MEIDLEVQKQIYSEAAGVEAFVKESLSKIHPKYWGRIRLNRSSYFKDNKQITTWWISIANQEEERQP
ncbi:MAG: hypothetical protein HKM92_02775 [Arenibacter sp.]|nr:hypothetical protein [Arenibacter sp.]